ncbi:BREX-1 system adenine-specific DNA-methyltransferase PglX [Bremerella alba]|uniref:site-specific DNA-methyltransferase (adenine-specific) n=1 Tax=Bremerella alba TaxID=980252 RepID=A0A7V8V837_9BACT|nr:BREX-1 system adenine-specific DNA-methyltransferase PglX [Bremerella alba]MBA2116712.1 hypothetical protein [Bremerella alba]
METKHLKKYAPEARRDFIEAVTNKAAVYGLLPDEILPMQEDGDVVIIGDRPFPRSVAKQRKELEERIRKEGFRQFIEAIAYTWFNRFVAIRYMELHGYLDHGYRVLSHPEGKSTPEILENAERIELSGLKRDEVVDLKLDGGKDEQLYQMLLLAQCNALHNAMPFLFESIKDGTELLLPDNLLHTDSLVRTLVNDIPEEQWENVEIIGWLYQFYISEKKGEVIGKVVKSEDIPAATQLFTPNWIVKYLVQNSLGRQWVTTYPDSPLKQQMEFYIEPAEQTAEVQQQLDEITPDSLNPEELTLLDPACGSGHILVEAYDLFKAIYTERGFRPRDISKLILTKNLYGLEIDDRAAQLAAFALMMKARADDRGIFGREVQPNVLSIQESKGLNAKDITDALNEPILIDEPPPSGKLFEEVADEKSPLFSRKNVSVKGDISQADVAHLIQLFEHGKTFGSLIQIPDTLSEKLSAIAKRIDDVAAYGEMFEQAAAKALKPLVQQSHSIAARHDAVVMNPPYMGSFFALLKNFADEHFPDSRSDLYSMFIERAIGFTRRNGITAMITMQGWMFLSSFSALRSDILSNKTLTTVAHLGPGAFATISGEVVQTVAFCCLNHHMGQFTPSFFRLVNGGEDAKRDALLRRDNCFRLTEQDGFSTIPGIPLAYWVTPSLLSAFSNNDRIGDVLNVKQGLATAEDDRFLRFWHEVPLTQIAFHCDTRDEASRSGKRWFPFCKGGELRRWYGNNEYIVDWKDDGKAIRDFRHPQTGKLRSRPQNMDYYFQEGITWSLIAGRGSSFRWFPKGFIIGHKGPGVFGNSKQREATLGFLNSSLADVFLGLLSPNLGIEIGNVNRLPFIGDAGFPAEKVRTCIELARHDWDSRETSWDYDEHPLLGLPAISLEESYYVWERQQQEQVRRLSKLEKDIDDFFYSLFGVERVPDSDKLTSANAVELPQRDAECERLISHAIGCMMGRFSLDQPGLIYACSGNEGFNSTKYNTFPAEDDGIVPLTDIAWFPDDAANRFEQFVKAAWPEEHLEENLTFVAENLGMKKSETPRECIRRYFATGFYKHHLSMYKKRPIYWLFSSGKQRAFQCLVYLHRYHAGTLSRMRTEYVVKLQGKINSRIDQLEDDIPAANSTSHRKKLEKERDTLIKQREELQEFDEKLRHYADQRIELDLDDGVKVNYGKFGDLLAEVKSITGKTPVVEVTT